MTDTLAPFGFRPLRMQGSGANTGGMNNYRIANAYGSNIFTGDPVTYTTDGTIIQASVSTDYVVGVFMGCNYVDPVTKQPRWSPYFPTGTSSADGVIRARVVDDPDATFLIQAGSSVTVGALGRNIGVSVNAGSTYTGLSGYRAAPQSGAGTGNGISMIRVVDFYETPENALSNTANGTAGAYPLIEVKFVQHYFARSSTG